MLRHSCGYYLADQGTDLPTMRDYLGHRDPKHRRTTPGSQSIGSNVCGDRLAWHLFPAPIAKYVPRHFLEQPLASDRRGSAGAVAFGAEPRAAWHAATAGGWFRSRAFRASPEEKKRDPMPRCIDFPVAKADAPRDDRLPTSLAPRSLVGVARSDATEQGLNRARSNTTNRED